MIHKTSGTSHQCSPKKRPSHKETTMRKAKTQTGQQPKASLKPKLQPASTANHKLQWPNERINSSNNHNMSHTHHTNQRNTSPHSFITVSDDVRRIHPGMTKPTGRDNRHGSKQELQKWHGHFCSCHHHTTTTTLITSKSIASLEAVATGTCISPLLGAELWLQTKFCLIDANSGMI